MKLAVVGVVAAGVGLVLGIPGLFGIGLFWVLMGLVVRGHAGRVKEVLAEGKARAAAAGATSEPAPAIDGRTFAVGTLLMLAIGLPSLAVGILEIGIDAEDADWRWFPIVVGGLISAFAIISGLMYAAGAGISAAADKSGGAAASATLWIRSVRETGTFVNERPRMEFVFRVEPDASTGLTSYDVTKKATVPSTAMAALRVGDGFRALVVGPDDPTSMTIDWDSPVPAVSTTGATPLDVAARLGELDELRRDARITDEEYQAQRQRILGSL